MLRTVGLSKEPAGYTSLSFLHPLSVPQQLGTAHGNAVTSFVIRNATSSTHDYHWSISLVSRDLIRRVHTGSVRLAPGRGTDVTRSVVITCTQGGVQIVVSLESPAESIHTRIACQP